MLKTLEDQYMNVHKGVEIELLPTYPQSHFQMQLFRSQISENWGQNIDIPIELECITYKERISNSVGKQTNLELFTCSSLVYLYTVAECALLRSFELQ